MHLRKRALAILLAAAMVITTGAIAPKTSKTASAATFQDLNQSQMTQAMGAGWNLGNQMESVLGGVPNETYWGNPVITENLIKAVKKAGFTSVRIPVSYMNMIGTDSNYTIQSSWLDRVQQVVDYCVNNGLYAIINMHGDGYTSLDNSWLLCGSSDQTKIRAKYKAAWKQIATRFKNYDQHLVFESMNEEFDGTYGNPGATAYANINAYNQIFVDTVRQTGGNNDKRWLLIPGWNTNINYTADNYGFALPTDNYLASSVSGKRIMISVHYYDPWDFCGQEDGNVTQWGSTITNYSKVSSWGDESYMISQFKKMSDKFVKNGYPVVIGEYGSIDKSQDDSASTANRAEFAYKVCTYAKQYGLVPVLWDNGYNGKYGFGVFDRNTCQVTQPKIIAAITKVFSGSTATATAAPTATPTVKPTAKPTATPTAAPTAKPTAAPTAKPTAAPTASTSTTETVIASATEKYEASNAAWLLNAKDTDVITLTYKSTVANRAGWGIMGWGASVNDQWVNGASYLATSNGTESVTTTFTAAELKASLGITSSSSISYICLSSWNGGYIEKLSIKGSGATATAKPTAAPTAAPTAKPTAAPTAKPTAAPTAKPTAVPTAAPTAKPTAAPTAAPTTAPTAAPTTAPGTSSDSNVSGTFTLSSDWGSGGIGTIEVTNTTSKTFTEGWTLEFTLDREITTMWSGSCTSLGNNRYRVTNPTWDKYLAVNGKISLTFAVGEGSSNVKLSNITLK